MDPFALVDWCYEDGRIVSIGRTRTATRQQLCRGDRKFLFFREGSLGFGTMVLPKRHVVSESSLFTRFSIVLNE